jgi:nucleotide-binding universal stress UspA family protein
MSNRLLGIPSHEILAEADWIDAVMIVMGILGITGLQQLQVGGVLDASLG